MVRASAEGKGLGQGALCRRAEKGPEGRRRRNLAKERPWRRDHLD